MAYPAAIPTNRSRLSYQWLQRQWLLAVGEVDKSDTSARERGGGCRGDGTYLGCGGVGGGSRKAETASMARKQEYAELRRRALGVEQVLARAGVWMSRRILAIQQNPDLERRDPAMEAGDRGLKSEEMGTLEGVDILKNPPAEEYPAEQKETSSSEGVDPESKVKEVSVLESGEVLKMRKEAMAALYLLLTGEEIPALIQQYDNYGHAEDEIEVTDCSDDEIEVTVDEGMEDKITGV
ncbi:hypothetical protein HU200_013410 [Digitaria exilis]|uniref:Uncharacterized protein n=1 Tax=Digitaria exilis TaxID=1010633 RepID=A0A835FDA1_9POAL|nr:hypothetical protein HU200_013410 [Digitaria exilis]